MEKETSTTNETANGIKSDVMCWVALVDKSPRENQLVITYNGKGCKVCIYQKALTWKGYKMKFVNTASKGFWDDEVTYWMPFPKPPCT